MRKVTKRNKQKQQRNKKKIYPSINIIFTFISINNKNNNLFDIFHNFFDFFIEKIIIEYYG